MDIDAVAPNDHISSSAQPTKRARTESFSTPPGFIVTKTQSYFVTLSPGLEFIAEEEIKELIQPSVLKRGDKTGKVFFATDKKIEEILKLRSIDSLYAFVAELHGIPSDQSGLQALKREASKVDWEPALYVWRSSSPVFTSPDESSNASNPNEQSDKKTEEETMNENESNAQDVTTDTSEALSNNLSSSQTIVNEEEERRKFRVSTAIFPDPEVTSSSSSTLTNSSSSQPSSSLSSDMEISSEISSEISNPSTTPTVTTEPDQIVFRVTGKRTGNQSYKSPQVAGFVGAGLIQKYGWKVDLKRYNMEILADLNGDTLVLGVNLSQTPLYIRHYRSALGLTSLKPSIAYCMARLAQIQPGDIVMDPMMGIGTIPIEAAEVWRHGYFLGGDISPDCVTKAVHNMKEAHVNNVAVVQWSVYKLPLKPSSVDIVISDVPFGRRVGTFKVNQKLYPRLFREITRVVKCGGKAIILTLEKGLMKNILNKNIFWNTVQLYPVDCGGYQVGLYLLERTSALIQQHNPRTSQEQQL